MTKRHRLFNAFVVYHNEHQNRLGILAFIRKSMKPELICVRLAGTNRCERILIARLHLRDLRWI